MSYIICIPGKKDNIASVMANNHILIFLYFVFFMIMKVINQISLDSLDPS